MIPSQKLPIQIFTSNTTQAAKDIRKLAGAFAINMRNPEYRQPLSALFPDEVAAADGLVFFPDCDWFSLCAAIAEREVVNPLFQFVDIDNPKYPNNMKPIVLLGAAEEWETFYKALQKCRDKGTLRHNPEAYGTRFDTAEEAIAYLEKVFAQRPTNGNRADHASHKAKPDFLIDQNNHNGTTPEICIAFFGSASTENTKSIESAKRAAKLMVERGWGVVHGGGVKSVMGALTEGANETGSNGKTSYVHGITTHHTGAKKLAGIESEGVPPFMHRYSHAKDMITRITKYADHSYALVALDGGIGSLEEIFLIAELIREEHPSVMYEIAGKSSSEKAFKPLILVNEDGMWDGVKDYFERTGWKKILGERLIVVDTVDEMAAQLDRYLQKYPPAPRRKEAAIHYEGDRSMSTGL